MMYCAYSPWKIMEGAPLQTPIAAVFGYIESSVGAVLKGSFVVIKRMT